LHRERKFTAADNTCENLHEFGNRRSHFDRAKRAARDASRMTIALAAAAKRNPDGTGRFGVARSVKLTQSSNWCRRSTGECEMREHAMIKVSVMYPNTPGARFNHEYYRDKHMPLVKARLGDACKYYTVDKGLAGGAPGAEATYVGMCHIFCDSIEAFQAGFGPHAKEIMADIPNYTDQAPVIQISEVVVG
jgi:uncharacterized protein (TIGR02118 family)